MDDNRREQLKNFIEREFIGPDPIDWPGLQQENGEEILISDPPRTRYIAGILFPVGAKESNNDDSSKGDTDIVIEDEQGENVTNSEVQSDDYYEFLEDAEELIDRSNAFCQSAMSITVAIKDSDCISVFVSAGTYKKRMGILPGKENEVVQYVRNPISWESDNFLELPSKAIPLKKYKVGDTDLCVDITFRYKRTGFSIYTFTLENTKTMVANRINDEDCYFQVKMRLNSQEGFHYMPEGQRINADDDYMSNLLLYRRVKNYAIGHGCAAEWNDLEDDVRWIETAVFPSYEVKPIVPSVITGVNLSMLDMSQDDKFVDVITQFIVVQLSRHKFNLFIMNRYM